MTGSRRPAATVRKCGRYNTPQLGGCYATATPTVRDGWIVPAQPGSSKVSKTSVSSHAASFCLLALTPAWIGGERATANPNGIRPSAIGRGSIEPSKEAAPIGIIFGGVVIIFVHFVIVVSSCRSFVSSRTKHGHGRIITASRICGCILEKAGLQFDRIIASGFAGVSLPFR
uniref:Uncharacterized protein n=1 Tax=Anopheles farauti TaxID=69004 RepID=A0A182QVT9_9DIPT